jgi:hypothetical protein
MNFFFIILILLFASCFGAKSNLDIALELAGENRSELESVLEHYKDDPEKLAAAKFLIENMLVHYSYRDSTIYKYYAIADNLLQQKDLPHTVVRDSLLNVRKKVYPGLERNPISDVKIMTANYLIYTIDHAFKVWKESEWAAHIDFDEFCETLLPYKVAEYQPFDYWRDTLSEAFSQNLKTQLYDDEETNTTFRTVDIVRNEMLQKVRRNGEYIDAGYPLLTASQMKNIAYGRCVDYVNLAVSTYRSVGIPCYIDATPYYGRFRAGHTWDVVVFGNGGDMPSPWDITCEHGRRFYPAQRFPKVYRSTYAINRDRVRYRNESALKYPFDYCQKDLTSKYTKTSDIEIDTYRDINLAEKFCYISIFNGHNIEWSIVDYGEIKDGKACFKNIGRNILYIVQGFDGKKLIPISDPFILHQNGEIEYLTFDGSETRSLDIRRKYYQNRNVVEMRERIHGGKIQGADNPDFRNAEDIFVIDDVYVNDPQLVKSERPHTYFRYLSPDGSYGSIAELKFYGADTTEISGTPIANKAADTEVIKKAFDDDYLSNFETENPDGNWVGIKTAKPQKISFVRIVPRSDDNDIRPGDTYELLYYNGKQWVSMGKKVATTNVLHYDEVPSNTLYWVKNHRRGWDERAFLIRDGERVEWW